MRLVRGQLAAVGVCTALAGCGAGSAKTIDPTRVEKAIEVSIAQQTHRLAIVVCPTGIKRAKGQKFNCIATLAHGEQFPFRVTQKDDNGNVHFDQATRGNSSSNAPGG